ncbi:MAG TPA: DUF1707 domain-containing protein [Streptosporangiaceae bacterium]|jgi:hypothetical protein
MNDRIRISDADREQMAARLREHYAQGRLSTDELEERITATFSAKTYGDLRHVMADLPEPESAPVHSPRAASGRPPRTVVYRHRGPRLLPLALIALVAALVVPGVAWLFLVLFKVILVMWLFAAVAGIIAAAMFRRRMRRFWRSGGGMHYWHQFD